MKTLKNNSFIVIGLYSKKITYHFTVNVQGAIPMVGKLRTLSLKNADSQTNAIIEMRADYQNDQTADITVNVHFLGQGYYQTIDSWTEKLLVQENNRLDLGIILDIKENLFDSTLDVIAITK
jgi:hypothetical protein